MKPIQFSAYNVENFNYLGEHLKTAQGVLVVPGAVVGNHWPRKSIRKAFSNYFQEFKILSGTQNRLDRFNAKLLMLKLSLANI